MDIKYNNQLFLERIMDDNLIESELKQLSSFCNKIDTKLEQAILRLKMDEVLSYHQQNFLRCIRDISSEPKIKLLLLCLFKYDKQNSLQNKALKVYKGIRSNEIPSEQINIETIKQLQETFQRIKSNSIEQDLLRENEELRLKTMNLELEIRKLTNYLKEIELKYKQNSCNILLELNDYINQRIQQRQLQPLIQQLQMAERNSRESKETINKLKRQLKQHESAANHLRKQNENTQKQIHDLKKQNKQYKNRLKQLQEKIKSLQHQLQAERESVESKQIYLINFFNQFINKDLQLDKDIKNKAEIIEHCKYLHRNLLTSSEILMNTLPIRQFITQSIENHTKKSVTKTALLYKYDNYNIGFGNYMIDYHLPFIVLFKLSNNRICGGYSPGLQSEQSSFLYTFLSKGRIFIKNQKSQIKYGSIYSNNALVFGNSELSIMCKPKKQFKLSVNILGAKYFDIGRMSDFLEGDVANNTIIFEEMEIHSIYI